MSAIDPASLLILDTSIIINLNATGCADKILRAIPNSIVVVNVVVKELDGGKSKNRPDAALLQEWVGAQIARIVELNQSAEHHFESLVIGPAEATLDDGEAATIAQALADDAIAVIDERKAVRLCAQRFPNLRTACTVDILQHPAVETSLGQENLADAVFRALLNGRMRVCLRHVDWVVNLIGALRARQCMSLPRSARLSIARDSDRT